MIEQLMNEYGYRESGTDDLLMPHVLTDSNSVGYGVGVESLTEGSWPFDQPSEPNGSTPMATVDAESYYSNGPKPGPVEPPKYMYFEAAEANSTVALKSPNEAPNMVYSIDEGVTWQEWHYDTEDVPVSSGYTTYYVFDTITLTNIGNRVYIKGVNQYGFTNCGDPSWFILTGSLYCHGNAQTLVDGDNPTLVAKTMPHFYGVGGEASALLSVPDLPATTLTYNCYNSMFYGCTSLTEAPELPATTLAEGCYSGMFKGCTSLTQAPELPATTLANYCYGYMFSNCTSLTQAPELPANTLSDFCYQFMFEGCTSLTQAPELPATTLAVGCYDHMFANCTSLTIAPELLAEDLNYNVPYYFSGSCYSYMFQGCTSLTRAPELPATTLGTFCYYNMFSGCTSLTEAPELPATTLAESCYSYMFADCTSLTEAPELPATALAENCYNSMFRGCTSLTQAPELPATTLANGCYVYMFYNCTSLTEAPQLPVTTLESGCYNSMFQGCTSLTEAPELPATTLANVCYAYMFQGCTSLNSVMCLAETVPNYSTMNWLANVSPTGTFTKSPNMSSWTTGSSGIPSGWTIQDYAG